MDTAAVPRRTIVALLAALVVLALVAAGCSSDDDAKPSGSSSSTASSKPDSTKPPACPSASEVDASLKAGLDKPTDELNGSVRTCTYNTTAGGDQVVIRYQTGVSAAEFAATAQAPGPSGEIPSPVEGLGDAAFQMRREEPGSTVTEVGALSGTTSVGVLAPVDAAMVESLVRTLIDQL